MTAEHLLASLEDHFRRLRERHDANHQTHQDLIMTLAQHLAAAVEKLAERLGIHDDMLAAAKKAEAAAEAERDDLKIKLANLEAKFAAEIDPTPVQAAIDKIESVVGKVDDGVNAPASSSVTIPGAIAPVVSQTPSGAIVSVDIAAGTTTHEAADGTSTVLEHATGAATASDAAGQPVPADPAAVAEAQQATASVAGG